MITSPLESLSQLSRTLPTGTPTTDVEDGVDPVTETSGRPVAAAVDDVRKTYYLGEPVHALDGVSLTLPAGSFTAVMGPSGSGKSTLLNLFGCLDTPDEGTVEIGGEVASELSEAERARVRGTRIGFVFQGFDLLPRLTAVENVALPMVFHGRQGSDRHDRARGLLERVGLGDRLDHVPTELSGGQRQRVAIARALANDPAILLADEPTGNLDTETGERIMGLFRDLNGEETTILMVTHERHIADHADRIVHLLDGRIEEVEGLDPNERGGRPRPDPEDRVDGSGGGS